MKSLLHSNKQTNPNLENPMLGQKEISVPGVLRQEKILLDDLSPTMAKGFLRAKQMQGGEK